MFERILNEPMKSSEKIALAFLVFTVSLALRDILFRYLMIEGVSVATICFWTGSFSFILSFKIFSKEGEYKLKRPFTQFIRLIINCISWASVIYIFGMLDVSTVSIITKSGMPLAVIFGSFFGYIYSSLEKKVSSIVLLMVLCFTYFSLPDLSLESIIALSVLTISIFFTVAEFIFISKSVKNEKYFYLSATPSVSLILVGLILGYDQPSSLLFIQPELLFVLLLTGIFFFTAYYSSIVRYRYLPPGIAEYPSLLTYFVLLPVDVFIFNKSFGFLTFSCGVLVLLGLSYLLRHRINGDINEK